MRTRYNNTHTHGKAMMKFIVLSADVKKNFFFKFGSRVELTEGVREGRHGKQTRCM